MGTSKSCVGLLDLKYGNFYSETSEEDNASYSFDVNEVRNEINSGTTRTSYTEMYIPQTIAFKDLKVVYRNRGGAKTVTRILTFDNELTFKRGKEYSISINLNVSNEIYN